MANPTLAGSNSLLCALAFIHASSAFPANCERSKPKAMRVYSTLPSLPKGFECYWSEMQWEAKQVKLHLLDLIN